MNEALYRLRALKMVEKKLQGMSLVAIGKEFGVSDQTVRRSLDWAATSGLLEDFEQQIVNELVPLAMQTLKTSLQAGGGDAKVAVEIFKGIGLFKKHSDKTVKATSPEDDLDSYIRKKRVEAGRAAELTAPLPSITEVRLLEGQLAEARSVDPPASPAGVVADRREDRPQVEDRSLDEPQD